MIRTKIEPYTRTTNYNDEKSLSPRITKRKLPQNMDCAASIDVPATTKHEKPAKRKTVRFGESQTYEVQNLAMNKRTTSKLWYSKQELNAIDLKNNQLIYLANMKGISYVESKKNQTIRGLEHLVEYGKNGILSKKRLYFQDKSRKAVIYEQQRQRKFGVSQSKRIKAIYRANGANRCQEIASQIGLHDEGIAMELRNQIAEKKKNLLSKLLFVSNIMQYNPKANEIGDSSYLRQ